MDFPWPIVMHKLWQETSRQGGSVVIVTSCCCLMETRAFTNSSCFNVTWVKTSVLWDSKVFKTIFSTSCSLTFLSKLFQNLPAPIEANSRKAWWIKRAERLGLEPLLWHQLWLMQQGHSCRLVHTDVLISTFKQWNGSMHRRGMTGRIMEPGERIQLDRVQELLLIACREVEAALRIRSQISNLKDTMEWSACS